MTAQTFLIERYDPDSEQSYEESFDVDVQPGQTVLDSLNAIKWEQDGTLSFRMSCRHAICGSCAMKVNGRSMLACQTQVDAATELGDPVRVGPMGNQKVIKDLVVDVEKFLDRSSNAPKPGSNPSKVRNRRRRSTARRWKSSTTGRTHPPASTAAPATPTAPSRRWTRSSWAPAALAKCLPLRDGQPRQQA